MLYREMRDTFEKKHLLSFLPDSGAAKSVPTTEGGGGDCISIAPYIDADNLTRKDRCVPVPRFVFPPNAPFLLAHRSPLSSPSLQAAAAECTGGGGECLFFTYELLRVERVYVGEEEVPSAALASARSTYSTIASPSIRPA